MRGGNFSLVPFKRADAPPGLEIRGAVGRRFETLSIVYEITGPISEILMPPPSVTPERRSSLWEETCFEFFLAEEGAECYWEFNLSPAGRWNAYRFSSYREGMHEEGAFSSLSFVVRREPDALIVSLELPLDKIIPVGRALEFAISAVIRMADGRTAFWALRHPGPEPDFHRRDGFVMGL